MKKKIVFLMVLFLGVMALNVQAKTSTTKLVPTDKMLAQLQQALDEQIAAQIQEETVSTQPENTSTQEVTQAPQDTCNVVCGECGRTPQQAAKIGHHHKKTDIVWVKVKDVNASTKAVRLPSKTNPKPQPTTPFPTPEKKDRPWW